MQREQSPFTKTQEDLFYAIKDSIESSGKKSIRTDKLIYNNRTLRALVDTHGLIKVANGRISLTNIPEGLTPVQRFVYLDIIDSAKGSSFTEKKDTWNWRTLSSLETRSLIKQSGNFIAVLSSNDDSEFVAGDKDIESQDLSRCMSTGNYHQPSVNA